jgi:hypothetical protein
MDFDVDVDHETSIHPEKARRAAQRCSAHVLRVRVTAGWAFLCEVWATRPFHVFPL